MSFVKRTPNSIGGRINARSDVSQPPADVSQHPGCRPSPLTGRLTVSTGVASLDAYLGGHAGLVLGSSLLIEEAGTTDYSGALLKFFAAEGLSQGHHLHVVGIGEQWTRELPGLAGASNKMKADATPANDEKMKIAWRYERLGQHQAQRSEERTPQTNSGTTDTSEPDRPFCHAFDLAKRLTIPPTAIIKHLPMSPMLSADTAPFTKVVETISKSLQTSPTSTVHRIIVPALLSPAFYPPHASSPEHVLSFLHALRSLLRQYSDRLIAMLTLPTELYRRPSGIVRWAENLSDGVIELQPFPHLMDSASSLAESGGARTNEDQPQGMLRIHKLPDLTDRGTGGVASAGVGDDLAFTLSRRKFNIRPFSLPPMEQEEGGPAQKETAGTGALAGAKKADIDF